MKICVVLISLFGNLNEIMMTIMVMIMMVMVMMMAVVV